MSRLTVTAEQTTTDEFINSVAEMRSEVDIQLADGKITLPTQLAVFNGLLWTIYLEFKIPITKQMVFFPDRDVNKKTGKAEYSFTSETVTKITNKIYNELILKYKIKDYMRAVAEVFICISRFSTFANDHARQYQVSLDALSLAELVVQPPVKKIVDRQLDCSHGTKYAERQMEQLTSDLMGILGDAEAVKNNCLIPFMRTKLLKRNQVPQMFGAYGTRSDINDEMKQHAISQSAFSGLLSIDDFAIETLSAKKAAFFNNSVIQDAQYFARRCRLGASKQPKLYLGSCGSKVTIPVYIDPKYAKNYIGKFVKVDDKTKHLLSERKWPQYDDDSVELTKANLPLFVGRQVQMWSPFGCRHTDGFCEHCAGYMHQRLGAYIPEGINIGVFCSTIVVSAVTQKILSAKHLIKTSSKEFNLPPQAMNYFEKVGDALLWSPKAINLIKKKRLRVRLEQNAFLGPLSDLTRKSLPSGMSFTKLVNVALINEDSEPVDVMVVTDDITFPYLSNYCMTYMKKHFNKIRQDQDYVDIPMEDFDFTKAFLKYTAVNDDMVSYVQRVDGFVKKHVRESISISDCLRVFSELIYDKTDVSIFPIEVMLRGYLTGDQDMEVPVIEDANAPVRFAGLSDVISNAALSTKLAFQGISAFFEDPKPTLESLGNGYGFYDPLFGFSEFQQQ